MQRQGLFVSSHLMMACREHLHRPVPKLVDDDATLDDLREAVTTLEDVGRIARRVFGGAHPLTMDIEENLRRAALAAREGTKIK